MILSGPIARLAFPLAALLCLFAPTVHAATLDVVGPAGAEVLVDGEVAGMLPLDVPLELPHGRALMVSVRLEGYTTHEEQIYLTSPTEARVLEVDLLGLDRSTAVVSSALLAGTGQFYQGRTTAGWTQLGLQLAAWTAVVYGELEFQDRRDEYVALDQEYAEARAPSEILRIREERDRARDDLDTARLVRNAGIGAVVAIAAWSAFDAWRGHDRFYAGVQPASAALGGTPTVLAGLRWNFGGGVR